MPQNVNRSPSKSQGPIPVLTQVISEGNFQADTLETGACGRLYKPEYSEEELNYTEEEEERQAQFFSKIEEPEHWRE